METCKPSSFAEYQELSDSFLDFDFSSIKIEPSIDFMKFSVHFSDLSSHSVVPFLKNNDFEVMRTSHDEGDETITNIEAMVSINNKWFGMYCQIIPKTFRTTFRMVNPDKDYFQYIYGILHFPYVVSEAEYSLDFHGCENGSMFSFLASHASLKNPGKLFTVDEYGYPPTQYLNSVRGNNQVGCKIYIKEKSALVFVRLEVSIKQRQYRVMGIDTLYAATEVSADEVFRKLQIEAFDFERFLKNLGIEGYEHGQFEEDFVGAMNGNANCGGLPAVKELVSSLKHNPFHYYRKHSFQDKLFNAIKGMKFV